MKETVMGEATLGVKLAAQLQVAVERNNIKDMADIDWLTQGDNIRTVRKLRTAKTVRITSYLKAPLYAMLTQAQSVRLADRPHVHIQEGLTERFDAVEAERELCPQLIECCDVFSKVRHRDVTNDYEHPDCYKFADIAAVDCAIGRMIDAGVFRTTYEAICFVSGDPESNNTEYAIKVVHDSRALGLSISRVRMDSGKNNLFTTFFRPVATMV